MRRSFVLIAACLFATGARADPVDPEQTRAEARLILFADLDDDDHDGIRDGEESRLEGAVATDVHFFTPGEASFSHGAPAILSSAARWVFDGVAVLGGRPLPPGAHHVGLQGLSVGRAPIRVGPRLLDVSVVELSPYDAHGRRVDPTSSHASISRVLPAFLAEDTAGAADQDALRWIAIGDETSLPTRIDVVSVRPDGSQLDTIRGVELWELACPSRVPEGLSCRATPLIRATADPIDRRHPESRGRSLLAEVGGRLLVQVAGRKVSSIHVGGPRDTSLGPVTRLRAHLRVHVLRESPGGPPAVGRDTAEAVALLREQVDTASLLWGQCGIHFGDRAQVAVSVVDPPPPHLIAVGCGLGLPASGGEIHLHAGKKHVTAASYAGESPARVAARLSEALTAAGFDARLSENPRIEPGALPTVDVLVRDAAGPVALSLEPGRPLSSDASLTVCVGAVDLSDGLSHFLDHDSAAGTLEERTLIKAYADRDPATIEVFVVGSFSSYGRVGESFTEGRPGSIQNTVILDRAAISAGAQSHVLAHELGHVLLEMPGHPDDYGVDQPSALMDADATDPSIFGPRRLSVGECERALRQRGPQAPAPLLEPWPWITP